MNKSGYTKAWTDNASRIVSVSVALGGQPLPAFRGLAFIIQRPRPIQRLPKNYGKSFDSRSYNPADHPIRSFLFGSMISLGRLPSPSLA